MELQSLTLTHNELLAILQILGTQSINGMDPDAFSKMSELELAERINSGVELLQQKQLLTFKGDNEIVFDDKLVALVGAAVLPETLLLFSQMGHDGSKEPHFFSATQYVTVEHYSPRAGIYEFMYLPNAETIRERVDTLLAPLYVRTETNLPNVQQTISDQALTQVFQQLQGENGAAVYQLLTSAGWHPQDAQLFVDDCQQARLWTAVEATNVRANAAPDSRTVIVVEGAQICWLCRPLDQASSGFSVVATSGRDCAHAILDFVPALERTAG